MVCSHVVQMRDIIPHISEKKNMQTFGKKLQVETKNMRGTKMSLDYISIFSNSWSDMQIPYLLCIVHRTSHMKHKI